MTYTPEGLIYLVKCPLENDYKNQLTFNSYQEQETYFNSIVEHSFSDYSYIKKDNMIKINANIDTIIDCNYLFYKNSSITGKIYYCFIDRMEYLNTDVTAIYFSTDVYQTYWAEIKYNPCFIEREHVNNDTIGANLVPENLETGEYICVYEEKGKIGADQSYVVLALTEDYFGNYQDTYAHYYNGIPSGLIYVAIKNPESLSRFINLLNGAGKIDILEALFLAPITLINPTWVNYQGNVIYSYIETPNIYDNIGGNSIDRPTAFDINLNGKYTPKNNKLFTYPYIYLSVDNNAGATTEYRFENVIDKNSKKILFNAYGCLSVGCDIKWIPENYKNILGITEGFNNAKFPVGSWNKNTFNNWIGQNGLNIATGLVANQFNSFTPFTSAMNSQSIFSSMVSQKTNTLGSMMNLLGEVNYHAKQGNTAQGNVGSSNMAYSSNNITPTFMTMTIKTEFAKIIDDFFSMYGYKINRIKIPNVKGRKNWNYVKTIGCNFSSSSIPQQDLQTIRDMFDRGVTFWHNPSTIYNYNNSNNIV